MEGKHPANTKIPTEDGGYQTYKPAGKLEGKKALITGGDSGIGRAVAILFAMEGADSLIAYLPEEQEDAQKTKHRVEKTGRKCYLYPCDVQSRENCKKLVDETVSKLGGINILVNNAAYQTVVHDISDLSEYATWCPLRLKPLLTSCPSRDQWTRTFDTNIHPYFFLSKYALEHMKSGDTIINCASINAYVGRPNLLDYTSTKGAIIAFTRGLSNQQVGKGIRVNAVAPGPGRYQSMFIFTQTAKFSV